MSANILLFTEYFFWILRTRLFINNALIELDQISKGIFKPGQFGLLAGERHKTFMNELYSRGIYPQGQPLDVSIIIKGRNFDTPPYIKL